MKRFALPALLLLASCRLGTQAKDFPPALRTTGVAASVRTGSTTVDGELLELRDSALVVLANQLTLIPVRAIQRAQFSDTRVIVESRYALRPEERQELRMLARYPYGIPDAALAKLLASKGQTAIVVVER